MTVISLGKQDMGALVGQDYADSDTLSSMYDNVFTDHADYSSTCRSWMLLLDGWCRVSRDCWKNWALFS